MLFADYIKQHNFDTKLPIIEDCFGIGLNVDITSVEDGVVLFGAPVFTGVKYYRAKEMPDYAAAFNTSLQKLENVEPNFSVRDFGINRD